jgi:D-ribose pyranose/furanose isomerase RbsD
MSFARSILLAAMAVVASGCGWQGGGDDWKGAVARQAGHLGYRNWIVVCEASFPAQNRPGIRHVTAQADVPEVVDYVLQTLEQTEHVRPRIYLTRELRSVENDYAPGVDELRKRLDRSLHGHEPTELDQAALLTLLQDASRDFQVLVIRTPTAMPYSSVFMELQPGYWDAESEERLRERIEQERTNRLVRPL